MVNERACFLQHREPTTPALGDQKIQAAKPAALVRTQLERFGDETPAMLTTTLNDTLAHRAEPVRT